MSPIQKRSTSTRIFITFGFLVLLISTFAVSWRLFEKRAERDVSTGKMDDFPVVVVTPENSQMILMSSLEGYKAEQPTYSFLVPEGKLDLVNRQLRESQRERGAKGTPEIRVEPLPDGRQLIELEVYSEGLFVSRYEASDKEVRPLTMKLAGPLFILFPCGITFIVGTLGIGFLQFVPLFLRRRQASKFILGII